MAFLFAYQTSKLRAIEVTLLDKSYKPHEYKGEALLAVLPLPAAQPQLAHLARQAAPLLEGQGQPRGHAVLRANQESTGRVQVQPPREQRTA
jgi:hypothetical protein